MPIFLSYLILCLVYNYAALSNSNSLMGGLDSITPKIFKIALRCAQDDLVSKNVFARIKKPIRTIRISGTFKLFMDKRQETRDKRETRDKGFQRPFRDGYNKRVRSLRWRTKVVEGWVCGELEGRIRLVEVGGGGQEKVRYES
jgi:hypothetical protein